MCGIMIRGNQGNSGAEGQCGCSVAGLPVNSGCLSETGQDSYAYFYNFGGQTPEVITKANSRFFYAPIKGVTENGKTKNKNKRKKRKAKGGNKT